MIHYDNPNIDYEFCIQPIGGLGNRLLALSAALRFIDRGYFGRLRIWWNTNDEMGADINDILTINKPVSYGPPLENSANYPLVNLPGTFKVPIHNRVGVCHYTHFKSVEDDNEQDITEELKHALRHINFNKDLISISDTIDVTNRIGIHCRRSDFWANHHELAARHHVKLDRFMADYLEKTYPNDKFFIATDSPYTLLYFEERFGNRIIHYPKAYYPLWRTRNSHSVREAVVDMILLSRCSSIIADSNSTFSLTASWLGRKNKLLWELPKL